MTLSQRFLTFIWSPSSIQKKIVFPLVSNDKTFHSKSLTGVILAFLQISHIPFEVHIPLGINISHVGNQCIILSYLRILLYSSSKSLEDDSSFLFYVCLYGYILMCFSCVNKLTDANVLKLTRVSYGLL
jgi:hypothetical protein